jgi:hypothetical protein
MNKGREWTKKYPMVIDWNNYEDNDSKLLCRCNNCGQTFYRTLHTIKDKRNKRVDLCYRCAHTINGNCMDRKDVQEIHRMACLKRSGREEWQCRVTISKENLETYVKSLPERPTIQELSKLLGFKAWRSMSHYLRIYNLHHLTEKFTTTAEREIKNYIISLGYENKKLKVKGMEIDIYLPSKNIAFEYNGLFYHSRLKKDKFYHQNKCKRMMDMGIKLYHLWEDEYLTDKELLFTKIKNYIENTPDFTFVEPELIPREEQHRRQVRIFECWSEGIKINHYNR